VTEVVGVFVRFRRYINDSGTGAVSVAAIGFQLRINRTPRRSNLRTISSGAVKQAITYALWPGRTRTHRRPCPPYRGDTPNYQRAQPRADSMPRPWPCCRRWHNSYLCGCFVVWVLAQFGNKLNGTDAIDFILAQQLVHSFAQANTQKNSVGVPIP
jgi:hypothetical protein